MAKEEISEVSGTVKEILPNSLFRVRLEQGSEVVAHVAGKIRWQYVRLRPGDRVTVAVSPYDLSRGRIVALAAESREG